MSIRSLIQIIRLLVLIAQYSCLGILFWCMEIFSPQRTFRLFYRHGYRFMEKALNIATITLRVEGLERLRQGENYVFIANHTSLFDIPAIWAAVGRTTKIRIIYKHELQYIPFLGWALRYSPFIPIRRQSSRDGMARITEAVDAIRGGSSVIVFAEGTRSRTGILGPFKRGAFMLAARSQKPLVPVAIEGAFGIMSPGTLRLQPGAITVRIGEPVHQQDTSAPGFNERQYEKHLMETLHHAVNQALPEFMRAKD